MVTLLTVIGFALPVFAYLALVLHYQVNAILADQWNDVPIIRQSYIHFPDWSSLWSTHNDNRILFPNLIVVGLAHTVHFNIDVEEYLSMVMVFVATALFILSHKRRSPSTPLLFYCPVAFLTLSFAGWQDALWGFQMAWYVVLVSLAATIALIDRVRLTWPIFALAVLAAVVGSYSSLQGLLIWPVILVLLYHRRRPLVDLRRLDDRRNPDNRLVLLQLFECWRHESEPCPAPTTSRGEVLHVCPWGCRWLCR